MINAPWYLCPTVFAFLLVQQWTSVIANRLQIFLVQAKVQKSVLQNAETPVIPGQEDSPSFTVLSDSEESPPK